MCVCVCVCVCMRERERERKTHKKPMTISLYCSLSAVCVCMATIFNGITHTKLFLGSKTSQSIVHHGINVLPFKFCATSLCKIEVQWSRDSAD